MLQGGYIFYSGETWCCLQHSDIEHALLRSIRRIFSVKFRKQSKFTRNAYSATRKEIPHQVRDDRLRGMVDNKIAPKRDASGR